ncbi:MAG: SDR family oxidoreductase [Colwellia sp.]|nr:SDR family oxidoreductase [Colwellia sp.]MCW8864439.1 SDR family oxidoreductase [Colwellia sp.]MCW9080852.1 SDR family oxidoreductase [Colwellia sp.]
MPECDMAGAKQKRIFITGGASGLGKAIALNYAKQGYKVCIGDVNEERGLSVLAELSSLGIQAHYLHCDITQLSDLEKAKQALIDLWGGVDIVVNNAGVAGTAGSIEDVSMTDWDWVININLLGVARGCKVFTALFKQQHSGYFINIASAAGLMNAPQMSSYNASKAGVISISETLKFELEKYNIGVSVVCPAFFKTNLTESMKSTVTGVTQRITQVMEHSKVSAEDVAQDIYNCQQKGEFWVLSHKPERKLWLLKRYLPFVFARVMKKQMAKLFAS